MQNPFLEIVRSFCLADPFTGEYQVAQFMLTQPIVLSHFPLAPVDGPLGTTDSQDIVVDLSGGVVVYLDGATNLNQAQIDFLVRNGVTKYSVYFGDTTRPEYERVAFYEV